MSTIATAVAAMPVIYAGLLGSLVAGLMTGVGALPIFMRRDWPRQGQVLLLALAAGIMLGATVFSLIVPALEEVAARGGSALGAALIVSAGVLLGAVAVWTINAAVPHEHFWGKGREGWLRWNLGRHWLFIVAITLHNFPEGMSVGVAYGVEDVGTGIAVTLGIGLQNLPEGLAVAGALVAEGFTQRRAFAIALLTGLAEPLGGLLGAGAVSLSDVLLPWGLAFAAGAMLFVISGEIIPETHREGREKGATLILVMGFLAMMVLDVIFS